MQPVKRRQIVSEKVDYKLDRLLLSPLVKAVLRVGLPLAVLAAMAGVWMARPDNRDALAGWVAAVSEQVRGRPEFAVTGLEIQGASPDLSADIEAVLDFDFPTSSFDLHLEHLREQVLGLPAVADVRLFVRGDRRLVADVTERRPVLLWRTQQGLSVLDAEGVVVAELASRAEMPDLPVAAGLGVDAAVPQALRIVAAARPLWPRMRGLERIGARRWDIVLDRGQRIMLPADAPRAALQQLLALNRQGDLLARDVTVVDLRLPYRPTLRMSQPALEEFTRIKAIEAGDRQ